MNEQISRKFICIFVQPIFSKSGYNISGTSLSLSRWSSLELKSGSSHRERGATLASERSHLSLLAIAIAVATACHDIYIAIADDLMTLRRIYCFLSIPNLQITHSLSLSMQAI